MTKVHYDVWIARYDSKPAYQGAALWQASNQGTDVYKRQEYTSPKEGLALKKGAGVSGNQGNKLYYYGLQIQADDYKYQLATIATKTGKYSFIVNSNGTIQHSKSTEYKEDGDVLVATGIKDTTGKSTETVFVENGQYKYCLLYTSRCV